MPVFNRDAAESVLLISRSEANDLDSSDAALIAVPRVWTVVAMRGRSMRARLRGASVSCGEPLRSTYFRHAAENRAATPQDSYVTPAAQRQTQNSYISHKQSNMVLRAELPSAVDVGEFAGQAAHANVKTSLSCLNYPTLRHI
jgi:hypothetical protein